MKTYLFDFDGTLVDSMPTFAAVMLRILDENGIKYPPDIIKTITPLGDRGAAEYYIGLGLDMTVEQAMAKMREYFVEEYTYKIPAKSGVIETLRKMKERGDDLNVLTASPHTSLDPCLRRLGIYELFSNVWSCDADFSTTKTDPEIYKRAAARIGVPVEQMIFVDDNLYADITGKRAGAVVYGIYDESSAEFESEIRAATDRYVYDFSELIRD